MQVSRHEAEDGREPSRLEAPRRIFYAIRHAFSEFLLVPTLIITCFLLLAAVVSALDRGRIEALQPARELLESYVFADAQGTSDLLGVVAGALITVTTLTTSLLLIALQQSASSLTHQVYDQFLRRRSNQFSFSFFIGLSLYALVTLATVGPINPVFGAASTFLLTIVALYLLLVLFYSTIDQMRPAVILCAIHDHALYGREKQLGLLRKTRRTSSWDAPAGMSVKATTHGFVAHIDVDAIAEAAARCGKEVEVVLRVSIGTFVAYEDPIADVKAHDRDDALALGGVVERAVRREPQRDITLDPLAGIEELENIAWTSISSAQSDPDPGLLAIYNLRDLLARWAQERIHSDAHAAPVVYHDEVPVRLANTFASLAVAASESMQHQTYAAILRSLAILFARLPAPLQNRVEDVVARTLPSLGAHVLTAELDRALGDMSAALGEAQRLQAANAVERARSELAGSIGKLRPRATHAG
jgi:uncharacterized membrane protein